MTWIKICGTTNLEDAQLAAEAGADALGFIFAPSPRQIQPPAAAEIIRRTRSAGRFPAPVGVFVNEKIERVREIAIELQLAFVQLHGNETDEEIGKLRENWPWEKCFRPKILKVQHLLVPTSFRAPRNREGQVTGLITFSYPTDRNKAADGVVLDTKTEVAGGSGVQFDWLSYKDHIKTVRRHMMPFIIAGGLTPENVGEAIRLFRPWGVDVVSGVESSPGKKDPRKVRAFIEAVRRAERAN